MQVTRAGSGTPPPSAAASAAASSAADAPTGISDDVGGNNGGSDARATVDAYMSSLRKQSAAVAHARAYATEAPIAQNTADPVDPQVGHSKLNKCSSSSMPRSV